MMLSRGTGQWAMVTGRGGASLISRDDVAEEAETDLLRRLWEAGGGERRPQMRFQGKEKRRS